MSQPTRILLALVLGVLAGLAGAALGAGPGWLDVADTVGGIWLDALQMTIIPLIVSLLITGIAATAEAARGGRLAVRALALFGSIIVAGTVMAAFLTPALLAAVPLDEAAGRALRVALGASAQPAGDVPGIGTFLRSIVPTNPVAAAAESAILPLILFTTLFGFAATRLPPQRRAAITDFFRAVADTMLILVNWVLAVAPVGVFALAFAVSLRTGTSAIGALVHYIAIVSVIGIVVLIAAYPLGILVGRVAPGAFFRAVLPAQGIALSTQSSLATLPQMLKSAEAIGVAPASAGVVLPLAVAIFRATSPGMNLAVAIYIAHWLGVPLGPQQIAAGVLVACITTLGAVSLPGQISFVTSIAPIAAAMGVPVAPLGLLVAVEVLPDIVRTVGNVTMDVAVTKIAAGREESAPVVERVSPA